LRIKTSLAIVLAASLVVIGLMIPDADATDNSPAPLIAAVRQYYHHLDQHWVKDFDHVPPGLPLTDKARADFVRKVGTIADTRKGLAQHGISVRKYDDDVALVGTPTFAADRRSATARFTVKRTREFGHAKFVSSQSTALSDQYIVGFVRSRRATGLGRWLIDSMTTPPVPRDDAGATVPPGPAVGAPASAQIPDVFNPPPKNGISMRTTGALRVAVPGAPPEGLDYGKMADYARQWSGHYFGTEGDAYNPDYPQYGNNCQNFVSQALFAGGWPEVQASPFQVEDDSKWDGHVDPWEVDLYRTTITWRATSHWMTFATSTGRVRWLPNLWDALPGDVIQTDWDPNDTPDGTVDHAMIVSGWDEVFGPYISQNSPHRQNIPLWLSMQYAQEQGKNHIIWYVART
jgi:hypothetical protein